MEKLFGWIPKRLRAPLGVLSAVAAIITFFWQFDSHYMALAADVAKTTTEATVNKAVIDGVKKAAKEAVDDAVKDKIDEVAQKAADAAIQRYETKKAAEKKPAKRPGP